jgi:peptide chain release factor 3
MKLRHVRLGREVRIADALTFMAADRRARRGGLRRRHHRPAQPRHDQHRRHVHRGRDADFTGIPNFAPELFRRAVLRDPLRAKALHKGLDQLCEEGATQLFRPLRNNDHPRRGRPAAVRRRRASG